MTTVYQKHLKNWRCIIPLTGKMHGDRLKAMATQLEHQLNTALEQADQNHLTIKNYRVWMDGSHLNIVVEAI